MAYNLKNDLDRGTITPLAIDNAAAATERQIRDHYRGQGCECRIVQGHVSFRSVNVSKRDAHTWRDGRWVKDYIVVGNQIVLV